VGIESLPADTVYPLEALNVGESIAVPMKGNSTIVANLYRNALQSAKQFQVIPHMEITIYEIVRGYDKVTKRETKTKQYIEAKDTIEETSEEDLTFESKDKRKGRIPKYPFGELQVGQSFIYHYEATTKAKLYNAMKNYERKYNKRFRLISNDKGEVYRVHRER
jgi:hypothetical protein